MAEKNLRSRSIAAIDREAVDSSVTNVNEYIGSDCVQSTDQIAVSDANDPTAKDLENRNQQVNVSRTVAGYVSCYKACSSN
jgi:hypothetical protein